jgi:hypothetical protein
MCILQRLDADLPRRAERFDKVIAIVRRAVLIVNVVGRSDSTQFSRFAKYLPQVASVHRVFKNSEPAIMGTLTFASILDDSCYYAYTVRHIQAPLNPYLRRWKPSCSQTTTFPPAPRPVHPQNGEYMADIVG